MGGRIRNGYSQLLIILLEVAHVDRLRLLDLVHVLKGYCAASVLTTSPVCPAADDTSACSADTTEGFTGSVTDTADDSATETSDNSVTDSAFCSVAVVV